MKSVQGTAVAAAIVAAAAVYFIFAYNLNRMEF